MNRDTIYILYHAPDFFLQQIPSACLAFQPFFKVFAGLPFNELFEGFLHGFLTGKLPHHRRSTADLHRGQGKKFDRAMQLGSNEERIIHEFCDQMQIPFDKIASEDFSAFMRILSLSKLLKNPNNMRGKARPQAYHGTKRKSEIERVIRGGFNERCNDS